MWMLARCRVLGLSRTASTALRGVERGCGEGSGPVSTLLGPEGTRDWVCLLQPQDLLRVQTSHPGGWPGGSVVSQVSGCSLRTTQWMRASLWQVMKSTRWMSWHQEPMKDVGGCEKPRGAANRAVIRGCPNGETRPQSCGVTRA